MDCGEMANPSSLENWFLAEGFFSDRLRRRNPTQHCRPAQTSRGEAPVTLEGAASSSTQNPLIP